MDLTRSAQQHKGILKNNIEDIMVLYGTVKN